MREPKFNVGDVVDYREQRGGAVTRTGLTIRDVRLADGRFATWVYFFDGEEVGRDESTLSPAEVR